jgi:glycosyltransferase involved in cell wall biosynthesis
MAGDNAVSVVGLDQRQNADREYATEVRSWFSSDVEVYFPFKWRWRDPRSLWAIFKAVRYLQRWQPDIIHIQVDFDYRVQLTLLAMSKIPFVDTVHDALPHLGEYHLYSRLPDFWLRRIVRRRASRIIVHGKSIKTSLCEIDKLPPEKVNVIPIPAWETYARYRDPEAVPRRNEVLFFGRIWAYKGLDVLIQSEPLVSAVIPEVNFVIAGKGEEIGTYVAGMVHPERFEIHNRFLTDREIADFVQRAAIVVAPYREASQSGVVAVAYALGRPVVVTNVGALAEAVLDGQTGFVVPPDNPQALANAIIRLLQDTDLRSRMGQQALALAEGDLSVTSISAQTLRIYEAVLR